MNIARVEINGKRGLSPARSVGIKEWDEKIETRKSGEKGEEMIRWVRIATELRRGSPALSHVPSIFYLQTRTFFGEISYRPFSFSSQSVWPLNFNFFLAKRATRHVKSCRSGPFD